MKVHPIIFSSLCYHSLMEEFDEFNSNAEVTNDKTAVDESTDRDGFNVEDGSKSKKKSKTMMSITFIIGLLGSGAIVAPAVGAMTESKVEITIDDIGIDYVEFSYDDPEGKYLPVVFNDFENIAGEPERYDGVTSNANSTVRCVIDGLRSDVTYYISIEGKSVFGSTSKAKKRFTTLKAETPPNWFWAAFATYGSFSVTLNAQSGAMAQRPSASWAISPIM